MSRHIKRAIATARQSTLRFRVGAVVANLGAEWTHCNVRKTHPQLRAHGYPEWADLHAELGAIMMAGEAECMGATVYVARLKRDGTVGLAKPCSYCMSALYYSGVKRVVWTVGDDKVEEVRL